jgi:hypothetical protein
MFERREHRGVKIFLPADQALTRLDPAPPREEPNGLGSEPLGNGDIRAELESEVAGRVRFSVMSWPEDHRERAIGWRHRIPGGCRKIGAQAVIAEAVGGQAQK